MQTDWAQIRPSKVVWIQSADTQMVFQKDFFQKVDFEKKSADIEKERKFPGGKELSTKSYELVLSYELRCEKTCLQKFQQVRFTQK